MPDTAFPILDDLMSESEVYKRYGHLFIDKELRKARHRGEIEWFDLPKGIFYTPDQLRAYLAKRRVTQCPLKEPSAESANSNASSISKTNGSRRKRGAHLTTVPGSAERPDESSARALRQVISRKPNGN